MTSTPGAHWHDIHPDGAERISKPLQILRQTPSGKWVGGARASYTTTYYHVCTKWYGGPPSRPQYNGPLVRQFS